MPDPIIIAGSVASVAYLGKKILGPTADYLGEELKEFFTRKRIENVGRIFSNAEKKLGKKLNSPGKVPPKVLNVIINEGSFSDENITVEYFGGVLASSRTEIGRDDRGSRLGKIIDNLSTFQIRTHYLIYSTISEIFSNSENSFGLSKNREKMQIFIPLQGYLDAMEFTQNELDDPQILHHVFNGLSTDGLIENNWGFGNSKALKAIIHNAPGAGIICTPSVLGVELFLWAFGHGDQHLEFLLTDSFSPGFQGIPKSISNAVGTRNLK